ncbi:DUF952 domain-containing protein [Gryllotalpicola koreensis]|uniref:DUF952 domain-containing protein n=1 Tax=Gryllotalpicola koreensis TaxID=993086 RepID=A0ABP7ZSE1_9MICO
MRGNYTDVFHVKREIRELLHLAHRSDWDAARVDGIYRTLTRGATFAEAGFVHASYADQLARVAEFVYSDDGGELCVLVLDADAIRAAGVRVIDEDGGDGELFPHIYGALRAEWVTATD